MKTAVVLFTLMTFVLSQDVSLLIRTKLGDVIGKEVTAPNGQTVYTFLGVPFAKSTAGNRRFLRPEPIDPWKDVLEAVTMPNACPQRYYPGSTFIPAMNRFHLTVPMSEDCLYLNIWLPSKPSNASKSVMVWFYGGGYGRGSISFPMFNGAILSSEGDVIVVTANYRVTTMGFLYLDDKEVPGNAGLYDQQLSVQWVRDNIAAFGGDPESITVFGQSVGATSAAFLLLAEPRNLFKRAIMQSGSVTAIWGSIEKEEARKRALEVAKNVGCPYDPKDTPAIIKCLREADPVALVEAEPVIPQEEGNALRPIRDGHLVPLDPLSALRNISFSGREILIGTTENEGTIIMLFQLPFTFSMLRDEATLEYKELYRFLRNFEKNADPAYIDAVIYEYTNFTAKEGRDGDVYDANTKALDYIIGDRYFTCPVLKMASEYTGGDVYLYRYAHRASHCAWPKWMKVYHAHENEMIFGEPLNPAYNYTQEEKDFSRQMISMWTHFAKTGKPIADGEARKWPKFTAENNVYARLVPGPDLKIGRNLRRKNCHFWETYLPRLGASLNRKGRSACSKTD